MLDLAVAIPTLVGSILSMFAAGSIFICYVFLPPKRHFRHTLILNLAAADFLNALNNSISGVYAFTHKSIPAGIPCSVNGLIGQLTVQATDFSVLFITITTFITLTRWNHKPKSSMAMRVLISLGIWIIPLATSVTGLVLDDYKPVSGNWCWLDAKDPVLRYALGHIWRLAIILTIICLYTCLFIYMHRHFSALRSIEDLNCDAGATLSDHHAFPSAVDNIDNHIYIYDEFEISEEQNNTYWGADILKDQNQAYYLRSHTEEVSRTLKLSQMVDESTPPQSPLTAIKQIFHPHRSEFTHPIAETPHYSNETSPFLTRDPLALIRRPPHIKLTTSISTPHRRITIKAREIHIQKLLLLNAYPFGYIILWLPGILNRFVELSGHQSRALQIAQASTQFVGLANALVYGYNERIADQALMWWRGKGKKAKMIEPRN